MEIYYEPLGQPRFTSVLNTTPFFGGCNRISDSFQTSSNVILLPLIP